MSVAVGLLFLALVSSTLGSVAVVNSSGSPSGQLSTPASVAPSPTRAEAGLEAEYSLAAKVTPGTQVGSSMVYDAADGYVVLYSGGKDPNDTWIFSNGNWSRLSASTLPPPHSWACMAYDWAAGYVVLFGGGTSGAPGAAPTNVFNDTWTYHAGVWTNITSTAHGPPGMMYMSCTYDAVDGYVLLFGGSSGRGTTQIGTSGPQVLTLNQTWKFAGGVWTNLTSYSAPHPSARYGAAMAYDSVDKYVVLYGGAINNTATAAGFCSLVQCPHYNQTWKYVGGTWTNISATASATHGTPPGRWAVGIANDTADGQIITFGGQDNGLKVASTTGNYTWGFVGGVWSNLSSLQAQTPPTRFGPAITYIPSSGVVIMFSGHGSTVVNSTSPDDTWFFIDGEWTNEWSSGVYAVTFTETGLPSGTNWSVALNGVLRASTISIITFFEPNATYSFGIGPVSGYSVNPSAGSLTVSGASIQRSVTFTSTARAATFLGLPKAEGYALVAGIVVVVIVGALAAVLLARRRRGKTTTNPPPNPSPPPTPPESS